MDGITYVERVARANAAAAQYDLAMSLYLPLAQAAIQFVWTALMRRTAEFGYAVTGVFEVTAPR